MTSDAGRRALLVLCLALALAPSVAADYTGSSLGVATSGSVTGDVLIETGSSHYSGEIAPGGQYSVTFPVSIPASATVRVARVYLFWSWSHDGDTGVAPTLRTHAGGATLSPVRSYSDRKGSPPYDYPSGTFVYDAAGKVKPGTPLAVTVTNTASSAAVAVSGAVLLIAYDGGGSAGAQYWVAEGADMIYATGAVTADAATTRATFTNVPAGAAGTSADLLAVVPGGNRGLNRLGFNAASFPGLFAGKPYADLAVATARVGPHLKTGSNTVTLRDEGDYMVPGLFVLRVTGEAPGTTTTTTTKPTTGTASPSASATPTEIATTVRATTTPSQTTTMTATLQPSQTALATTSAEPTFAPVVTVLPSVTATASAPATGQTAPPEANTTTPPATVADVTAASTSPVSGETGNVSTTVANNTVVTITRATTAEPSAMTTTEATIEPTGSIATETTIETPTETTTEPTTMTTTEATTEPTTARTTTATTAHTPVEPVLMGDPPAVPAPQQQPTPDANASVADGRDPPGPPTDAAATDDLTASLLVGNGALPGLGIAAFGLLVGAGIVVAASLVGAGIATRLMRAGERRRLVTGGVTADRAGRSWRDDDDH